MLPLHSVHSWAGDTSTAPGNICHAAGARANLTRFLDAAASRGLFVILRIGPFICGEWSYGGIPSWINGLTTATRAHNPGWESAMVCFDMFPSVGISPVALHTSRIGGVIITPLRIRSVVRSCSCFVLLPTTVDCVPSQTSKPICIRRPVSCAHYGRSSSRTPPSTAVQLSCSN